MTGSFDGSSLELTGDHWISQPPGYLMVDLSARYDSGTPSHLDGSVSGPSCTSFSVDRTS
jgi:hypothetical protein